MRGNKYPARYVKNGKTLIRPEYQAWNHMKQRCLNKNEAVKARKQAELAYWS